MKEFTLPVLDYKYDALEPMIDAMTMEIHHSRHHQAYTNNFNVALKDVAGIEDLSAEEIVARIKELIPEEKRQAVMNHGGGYVNHALFFDVIGPNGGGLPTGALLDQINQDFGSFEAFKTLFVQAATAQFGSGWAWLVVVNGHLEVRKSANQDSPLVDGVTPILGIDVWEHAYYLKYQNKRPEYIENFFNVIRWDRVATRFEQVK